jgi:hypothetical protein
MEGGEAGEGDGFRLIRDPRVPYQVLPAALTRDAGKIQNLIFKMDSVHQTKAEMSRYIPADPYIVPVLPGSVPVFSG